MRRAVEHGAQLVDRVGDVGRRWSIVYQRAAVAHLDDELDLAEQLSEEALVLFSDVSPSRAFAVYGAQLLPIRHAQGRVLELAEPLEALLADQPGVPAWNAALALALVESAPARARAVGGRGAGEGAARLHLARNPRHRRPGGGAARRPRHRRGVPGAAGAVVGPRVLAGHLRLRTRRPPARDARPGGG